MNRPERPNPDEFRSAVIMTVVWVAGLTLVVIFVALFAGILLDRVLNTRPVLTVLLTVASIPLTIYLTLRVVRSATKRLQATVVKGKSEEVPPSGNKE